MEDIQSHSDNLTSESTHLMKALLDRRRRADVTEPADDSPDSGTDWVTGRHFTVEVGKRQIAEYIQTWQLRPSWLYTLDFLSSTEEEHRIFYHYRARFSQPSQQKPVQGTASVYFVVDVSKIKPPTLPVDVVFAIESNRLVHTAGRTRFTEKWLTDVIESKGLLRRAVDL